MASTLLKTGMILARILLTGLAVWIHDHSCLLQTLKRRRSLASDTWNSSSAGRTAFLNLYSINLKKILNAESGISFLKTLARIPTSSDDASKVMRRRWA